MVKISGYEWELLESNGHLAGLGQNEWYEYFLATNDLVNLERLKEFYDPPKDHMEDFRKFEVQDSTAVNIEVVTDLRLIQAIVREPKRLLTLTPREFECFTAELLESLGYTRISLGPGSKDGGVDVSAFIEHPLGVERLIVQCKRYSPAHKVGEPIIKQLYADIDIHHAVRGLVVTTSRLTRGARVLIETFRHRLSSLDYDELIQILKDGAGGRSLTG